MFRRTLARKLILAAIVVLASYAFAQWNEQVLYSFQYGSDGAQPVGSVVFDKQGNLYGVTSDGGANNCAGVGGCGIVYELSPPARNGGAWTETILHVFRGLASGDGSAPVGGLVMDAAGNLYGTTAYDGAGQCTLIGYVVGCGIVFEMSPPSQPGSAWTETVLYSFQGGNDGSFPWGDLVFDKAGNLYGATRFGGGKGTNCNVLYGGNCGTIFELSPPKSKGGAWTEQVLHSFSGVGQWSVFGDGGNPNGGLVLDDAGNIYGTTQVGGVACLYGSEEGCGTVFRLAAGKGGARAETILHAFLNIPDGSDPVAGLALGVEGNLYGTTYGGGSDGFGTAFELVRPSKSGVPWAENILYSWSDTLGAIPSAPPLIDSSDASIYLTTAAGGTFNRGTLSRLQDTGSSWADTVLYNFGSGGSADAQYPYSKLVLHAGALFSNSLYGGAGSCQCGTVFEVWP